MAWTETARLHDPRESLRHASDLTDAEWGLVSPFLPTGSRQGGPRKADLRAVLEAIRDMASTGCLCCAVPKDFWPYSTVMGHVYAWSHGTCWLNNSPMPVMAPREHRGREASPSRPASSTAGR